MYRKVLSICSLNAIHSSVNLPENVKVNDSDDLAMYLLEVAHVACVGGASFGAPECIRMSYATSDENIVEAIRRIKEALAI